MVCDYREDLPLGGVAFEIRGGVHHITIGGKTVAVASVVVRLTARGHQRFYFGWINELEVGVVELLVNQPELPILLASPLGESVGSVVKKPAARQRRSES